ncbi:AraC family transcriptional regulator [uncultured Allobaculum sp.]|uniref:AraC family transcriptional regulator n=1 Tax=uncultured Allobaculum sp. TaxID=1187017 RepID=UPI00259A725F|nr:AraC family transcriptional regulator [uncultured Allobaculum sp.]
MLKRTTHYQFQPYGSILYDLSEVAEQHADYQQNALKLTAKSFSHVYSSNEPCYIQCKSGIVLMAVSKDGDTFENFVIHRIVKTNPETFFNFISISDDAEIDICYRKSNLEIHPAAHEVTFSPMVTNLHIHEILTTFYQVRKEDYVFPGEAHSYYELVYIDHGSMEMDVDGKAYSLSKYDLMLYYPGQFHSHYTKHDQTCSYLTVIFKMDDTLADSLCNRVFHTRKDIYQVLCSFMKAVQTEDYLNQELAILYLKEVIILLHQFDHKEEVDAGITPMQQYYEHTLLNEILVYINNNICSAFTVEDLCIKFSVSRSSLQNLFRTNLHISPKQYISNLKLNHAKLLIQEHNRTISEISDMLGFTSIHYFSRKFKKQYGLSPTDYSKSIHP